MASICSYRLFASSLVTSYSFCSTLHKFANRLGSFNQSEYLFLADYVNGACTGEPCTTHLSDGGLSSVRHSVPLLRGNHEIREIQEQFRLLPVSAVLDLLPN